ncbi:MAG: NAD(P)H-binding protein [Caulobacteraceae bacterium]
MTTSTKTALVIGATGGFGAHATLALIKHGWTIRAMARDPAAAARRLGERLPIEWVQGDAMNAGDVLKAARDQQVIVHAVNPPRYKNWRALAVPPLDNTIAAAVAEGARILLPGNVYNYAPDAGERITEEAPQAPITRKGKIRVEMEEKLREATRHGARVLILRAGDFIGPDVDGALSWAITQSKGVPKTRHRMTARPVPHAFAYLPDLGEAAARLLDKEASLAAFENVNFRGHHLAAAEDLGVAVARVTGRDLPLRPFPWALLAALSPVVEMFRELGEMRYLWDNPIGLDNAKLERLIGPEPHTALDDAVRASLPDAAFPVAMREAA